MNPRRRRFRNLLPQARSAAAALLPAIWIMACSSSAPEAPRAYVYPVPLNATFDMARGSVLSEAEEAQRLTGPYAPRIVFLGEHHGDPRSRAEQLRVLRLLVQGGRRVAVALEMFPPQADAALDAWREGKLTEAEFVEQSRWYDTWGFPWRSYRDLFLAIREAHLPAHGVNADEATRAAVRENRLDSLAPDIREEVGELDLTVLPHRDYLSDSLRETGHGGAAGEGGSLSPDSPAFLRLQRVQVLWDRLMGVRAARLAEAQQPPATVVVILGSGHVAHGLGANLRAARVSSLPLLSVWDDVAPPESLDAQGRARIPLGMADWVRVYAEDRNLPSYPRLTGVRLKPDPAGVRVEAPEAKAGRVQQAARTPDGKPALQDGDVVQGLNGMPVHSPAELRLRMEDLPWGEPAKLTLLRTGAPMQVTFTPANPDPAKQ